MAIQTNNEKMIGKTFALDRGAGPGAGAELRRLGWGLVTVRRFDWTGLAWVWEAERGIEYPATAESLRVPASLPKKIRQTLKLEA